MIFNVWTIGPVDIGIGGKMYLNIYIPTNPNANWTYGQSIENRDIPPFRRLVFDQSP